MLIRSGRLSSSTRPEVGLMLAGPQGSLRVMAATTERMRMVDLFELQANEGPCLDCYQSGQPVLNISLQSPEAPVRWPVFTPMAREAGFDMVHAPSDESA